MLFSKISTRWGFKKSIKEIDPVHPPNPEKNGSLSSIISEGEKETINYLTKFTNTLNDEIKRVYLFFISSERELYVSINSHLHIRYAFK